MSAVVRPRPSSHQTGGWCPSPEAHTAFPAQWYLAPCHWPECVPLPPAFHFSLGWRRCTGQRRELRSGLHCSSHSWQLLPRDLAGEGRVEGKRSLLGFFAFFAKKGGSSVFPLKIASPLSRPPTPMIWGLGERRHESCPSWCGEVWKLMDGYVDGGRGRGQGALKP